MWLIPAVLAAIAAATGFGGWWMRRGIWRLEADEPIVVVVVVVVVLVVDFSPEELQQLWAVRELLNAFLL